MPKFSIIYGCIVFVLLFSNGGFASGSPIDINKEIPNPSHSSLSDGKAELMHILSDALNKVNNRPVWIADSYNDRIPKRSMDELDALLREATDADILNLPLRSLDKEKLQNLPLLQYIVIRKQSEKKRSHDYNPRLGRSSMAASASADDDDNQASPAPRNSNQALFAPRLGKKSLEFSPRLGRSFYLE